jgi:streptogramin lyase
MMNRMNTASVPADSPKQPRFRIAVVVVSVVAALGGSVLLATRDAGEKTTTRGITSTLAVPGHPGAVAAGAGALWVALKGEPRRTVGNMPLVHLDLATGTVTQTVHVGGEVSFLAHVGDRLIASVTPVGHSGSGPRRLVAVDWVSGTVLSLGESHLNDTDARRLDGPVDQLVQVGHDLWALESRPGRLLRLNASTLAPSSAPIRLSTGRTLGLAAGSGSVWVTAADTGEVLRIDLSTGAVTRTHVGGFPVGIAVSGGSVWFADRSRGTVARLDASSLRPVGGPIHVSARPTWIAVAGGVLFVTDERRGTISQVDVHSGRKLGPPIRIAPANKDAVPPALAATGESVWVSSFASNTVTRITPLSAHAAPSVEVTFEGTGDGPVNPGNGFGVTDGGVASTGRFALTGAINDTGRYTSYRTVKDQIATIRTVAVGVNGMITIVITINLSSGSAPWTIASGTRSYAGLHGKGTLTVDNFERNPYTFVMKGTVGR